MTRPRTCHSRPRGRGDRLRALPDVRCAHRGYGASARTHRRGSRPPSLRRGDEPAMRGAGAPQGRRRLRRRDQRFGEPALIGKREMKHLRPGDSALRRLSRSGDDEVADAASFDLGGAFDDRERFRRQPRLQPGRSSTVPVDQEIFFFRIVRQNSVQSTKDSCAA